MPKYYLRSVELKGHKVPVRVYSEWRSSIRFSVGKSYLILRVPMLVGNITLDKNLKDLQNWVSKKATKNPGIISRLVPNNYENGDTLNILSKTYTLNIQSQKKEKFSGKLIEGVIYILYPEGIDSHEVNEGIRDVIIKLLNRAYQPYIKNKVLDINQRFFKEKIERVSLKYNTSNWGSCSSKRNINLSTRLLLTNNKVLDYVIVHELSHLKEMNHSKRFWKIVEGVMPDYEDCERWLTKNGKYCYL